MSGPLTDVSAWDILMGYAPETEGMGLGERSAILVDRLARSVVPDALERPVDALLARVTGRVPSAAETSEAWPDRHSYLSTAPRTARDHHHRFCLTRGPTATPTSFKARTMAHARPRDAIRRLGRPAPLPPHRASAGLHARTDRHGLGDHDTRVRQARRSRRLRPLRECSPTCLPVAAPADRWRWQRRWGCPGLGAPRRRPQAVAEQLALEYASLQQQAELERLHGEQQQRQFAAQTWQALNELMSQNWESALPWTLPSGTDMRPPLSLVAR